MLPFPYTSLAIPVFGLEPPLNYSQILTHSKVSSIRSLSPEPEKKAQNGDWDEKNKLEHDAVTDYIVEILRGHALEVQIESDTCVSFGTIEHLCNRISAFGEINTESIISNLAPTPAVCGYPTENAHKYIEMLEHHSRHCYGGWIGMKQGSHSRFFVNLRSAFVEKLPDGRYRYNIYGGGGITKKSKPLTEWNEAQAKMEPLLSEIKSI